MTGLKTRESLLDAIKKASTRIPTEDELHKQRVSFIMGSLHKDSTATRALVEQVLAKQEGRKAS